MKKTTKITVLVSFRDVKNFDKEYAVGEYVDTFDEDRIAKLIELGYVEITKDLPPVPPVPPVKP